MKNKVAPPFRRAEFDIMFGEGISRSGEIIDLGVDLGIIKKSGSWFSYNDAKLAQGRDAAKRTLTDNPELADEIAAKILEMLKSGVKPAGKPAKGGKASKDTSATASAPAAEPAADFDTDLGDDPFSIEEDL